MPSPVTDQGVLAVWSAPPEEVGGENPDRMERVVVGLFEQFRDPMLRYLAALGLAHADGEEVVQEVFLLLCNHLRRGRPHQNLRGWLFRVAHNLALKSRHRASREGEARSDAGAQEGAVDPGPSPEAQVAATQHNRRLQTVVEALPEQDRRCLFLRAEGLRYREIGEVLDMSLGAVSLSLARSLARIARAVER
jgi:RNA polymerase sigma-70 factor, ECF subfamily